MRGETPEVHGRSEHKKGSPLRQQKNPRLTEAHEKPSYFNWWENQGPLAG
ncbi:MAG: hypothetical protein QOF62_2664 [Pyrinomonadaceae bacterium]|jgi:hypothetical protein|nr:hypothetical protein [Pyrinomonadaceae bacterium]